MAFEELLNTAELSGVIDGTTTGASDAVTVYLVDGLNVTKTADKSGWGGGMLKYTVAIENATGFAYENVVFTDLLEPTKVALDTDTVYMGTTKLLENTDFTYNQTTGLLTINTTPQIVIADGETLTITFQVEKV